MSTFFLSDYQHVVSIILIEKGAAILCLDFKQSIRIDYNYITISPPAFLTKSSEAPNLAIRKNDEKDR